MASISTSFQELQFPSYSDTNPQCGICWEHGAPELPLFNIHTSDLPEKAERHLACRSCVVKLLTNNDLTVKEVFTCHICRKEVAVDLAVALRFGLDLPSLSPSIYFISPSTSAMTPTLRAVEAMYRRITGEGAAEFRAVLPHLPVVTDYLVHNRFS